MAVAVALRGGALTGWQRQIVLAAASLIRERFGSPPGDSQARAAHDGLLEVLDPQRRAVRLQREQALAAHKSAMTIKTERRSTANRRTGRDRRRRDEGPPNGVERRRTERRASSERRVRR